MQDTAQKNKAASKKRMRAVIIFSFKAWLVELLIAIGLGILLIAATNLYFPSLPADESKELFVIAVPLVLLATYYGTRWLFLRNFTRLAQAFSINSDDIDR